MRSTGTRISLLGMIAGLGLFAELQAAELGTAFTYQGRILKNGVPVTDTCDLRFGVFDAPAGGIQKGNSPQTKLGVAVTAGLFTVPDLDFGSSGLDGSARWLEIEIKCVGDPQFILLSPRVALTPAPYALALPGMYTQQSTFSPNLIGGRFDNFVTPGTTGATIAGGGAPGADINRVTDTFGSIGGGCSNRAGNDNGSTGDAQWATVAGGLRNIANGTFSMIPGGSDNTAGGPYSFAAGRQARVRTPAQAGDADGDQGTFLWADTSFGDFFSTGPNQFLVRASGGTTFYSNSALNAGVTLPAGGGAWGMVSDKNLKENFAEVDAVALLEKLAAIPITTWNYISQDDSIRHIGPMGQDFAAVFGVGEEETRITTIDADGVALAAIQGLYEVVKEKNCEIEELRERNDLAVQELRNQKDREIAELTKRLARMETLMTVTLERKGDEP